MKGLDYDKIAQHNEQQLWANDAITETNKDYVRSFLLTYHVSPARRSIFFRMIRYLLSATPDLKADLSNRDLFNRLFAKLYQQYRPATYSTIVNVSRRFVRWLNDGVVPSSFRDIRTLPKSQLRRNLAPDDMVTWSDGLQMARMTTDLQHKAILLTQLDGGLRPSELLHLDYGDIKLRGPLVIVYVRKGKTGQRVIVLHRCVEALRMWLEHHPSKRKEDPLWVSLTKMQHQRWSPEMECVRLSYEAMRKQVRKMARRAGITKPVDFYSLRHASCVLDKKSNLPVDLAAERHGHSVRFYTEVYGRLSEEDIANRFLEHYGIEDKTSEKKENPPRVEPSDVWPYR